MPRSLIIDGYNLAFAWKEVRPLLLSNQQKGRERLLDLLRRYKKATGQEVLVVFDGPKESSQPRLQTVQGIKTTYSAFPKTADDDIRKMIQACADKGRLLVISSDHQVSGFAERRNVETMGSGTFAQKVEQVLAGSTEAEEKPQKADVADWLKFFQRDKNTDD
ncbi:NYN domain-containing protein [candidate division TA06 bacterium]|uniref:NYN domain-containing protein n=1 Tax=candidate division TA06 bacterium TaxID=2250710 RepID=A0A933I9W8_UNCT6|nr:NYN domain-containing protein [candidate division TA06 bacterium]